MKSKSVGSDPMLCILSIFSFLFVVTGVFLSFFTGRVSKRVSCNCDLIGSTFTDWMQSLSVKIGFTHVVKVLLQQQNVPRHSKTITTIELSAKWTRIARSAYVHRRYRVSQSSSGCLQTLVITVAFNKKKFFPAVELCFNSAENSYSW